ncbi:hypothetical protein BDV93DRAFT_525103 [Ceratobasidium sp. AG-I]|nr:hypothetical protein BDV93DRAFT_525103 [Ceratobasidium sp. AG-I]
MAPSSSSKKKSKWSTKSSDNKVPNPAAIKIQDTLKSIASFIDIYSEEEPIDLWVDNTRTLLSCLRGLLPQISSHDVPDYAHSPDYDADAEPGEHDGVYSFHSVTIDMVNIAEMLIRMVHAPIPRYPCECFETDSRSSTLSSADTVMAQASPPPVLPPSRTFASCEVDATTPAPAPRSFTDSSVETDPVVTPILPSPSPLPSLPTVPGPTPQASSFAGVTAQAAAPRSTGSGHKHSRRVTHPAKTSVPVDPVRYVVRLSGDNSSALHSLLPTEPFRLASLALSLISAPHVPLLAAYWNRSNNLMLAFPAGTPDLAVQPLLAPIRSALSIDPAIPISRVVNWSKVLISSVPTRDLPGSPTFSEEAVTAALAANPPFSALSVMRAPRWVRNPASITKPTSSITISFEDPDGSVSRNLLKTCLFAFGAPLTIKRWIDKPGPNAGPARDRSLSTKTK